MWVCEGERIIVELGLTDYLVDFAKEAARAAPSVTAMFFATTSTSPPSAAPLAVVVSSASPAWYFAISC